MYRVEVVANFFLSKEAMSPKKLQKLLYYAYGWTLALLNDNINDLSNRLFDERIEAWVHGPVIPFVYNIYKSYGWNDIPKIVDFDDSIFSNEVLDVLNQVWEVYRGYTGNELESISHSEAPWIEARGNLPAYESSDNQLSDRTIFEFFNEQAA